jgi:BASS family bile acid:Na+ symporter
MYIKERPWIGSGKFFQKEARQQRVFLLHVGGFLLGYFFSKALGYDKIVNRTMLIEIGMQNSGLGVALAQSNFHALPTAPVPCAISSAFHSVIGSLLAGIWRLTSEARKPSE